MDELVGQGAALVVQDETEAPGTFVPGASIGVVQAQEASTSSSTVEAASSSVFSASASSEMRI